MSDASVCLTVQRALSHFFGRNLSLSKYFWGRILWRNDHWDIWVIFYLLEENISLCFPPLAFGMWADSWLQPAGAQHFEAKKEASRSSLSAWDSLPVGFPKRSQYWKKLRSEAGALDSFFQCRRSAEANYKQDSEMSPWDKGTFRTLKNPWSSAVSPQTVPPRPTPCPPCLFCNVCLLDHLCCCCFLV